MAIIVIALHSNCYIWLGLYNLNLVFVGESRAVSANMNINSVDAGGGRRIVHDVFIIQKQNMG